MCFPEMPLHCTVCSDGRWRVTQHMSYLRFYVPCFYVILLTIDFCAELDNKDLSYLIFGNRKCRPIRSQWSRVQTRGTDQSAFLDGRGLGV